MRERTCKDDRRKEKEIAKLKKNVKRRKSRDAQSGHTSKFAEQKAKKELLNFLYFYGIIYIV